MSYKALAKIKKTMEIEYLKTMSYEDINNLLNRFKSENDKLKIEVENLKNKLKQLKSKK